ncbi:MAG: hypothetical protein Q6363_006955, partial [Candidatus Njordarchaeota archaeon]
MSEEEHYAIIDHFGSWNVGAFIVATNNFTIVGEGFRPQILSLIEKVLNAPVIVQRIYDEDLIG